MGTKEKFKRFLQQAGGVPSLIAAVNEDLDQVTPETGLTFDGGVDLSKGHTIYNYLTVEDSSFEVYVKETPAPIAGGYAEVTLVGDGAVTPTFDSGMTAMPNSDTYDPTLNTINKVGVYYDGVTVFYTITVIS